MVMAHRNVRHLKMDSGPALPDVRGLYWRHLPAATDNIQKLKEIVFCLLPVNATIQPSNPSRAVDCAEL